VLKPTYYLIAGALLVLALVFLLVRIRLKIKVSLQQEAKCRAPMLDPEKPMGALAGKAPPREAGPIEPEES